MVRMQLEQAEQKVELQVNKLNCELAVANRKFIQAQTALQNAEDNLKNATESFAAGVISSGDLMQVPDCLDVGSWRADRCRDWDSNELCVSHAGHGS